MLLLTIAVARADCAYPSAPERFGAALGQARVALEAGDFLSLQSDLIEASGALPCLDEPVAREQAADYHRLMGTAALLAGRDAEAVSQLQASLALAPQEVGGAWLEAPAQGWWIVDGARSLRVPGRPYILQRADADGRVVETRAMAGGPTGAAPALVPALAPALATPADLPALPPALPAEVWQIPKPSPGWLEVAGGATVVSGGLLALARVKANRFYDLSTPESELESLRGQTNALVASSAALGVVAVGAAGAAFVVRW